MFNLLEILNLKTYYYQGNAVIRAVDDITLAIRKGEVIGIAGESGCGKTTLALSILRILPRNARIVGGKILFRGTNLLSLTEEEMMRIRQRHISIIFQGPSPQSLNPLMFSGIQVAEAIEYHLGKDMSRAIRMAKELFEEVELGASYLITLPHELSAGMLQRVKIAMALSTRPELIIADEPLVGLNTTIQAVLMDLLMRLKRKYGVSLMYLSHNLARMAEIADRVAIMYAGKILEIGPTKDIFERPIHPYTKGLIGALPRIKKIREQRRRGLIWVPGNPPSPSNPPKGCRFHPRCPIAKEICKTQEPPRVRIGESIAYCHFAEEIKDTSPYDFWAPFLFK